MIPAHGYTALYEHQHTRQDGTTHTRHSEKPVIAWDEDGRPLVVREERLQPASSWANYRGVSEVPVVVAAVPGGGWLAEYREDNGTTSITPVVAWTIHADGSADPIITDNDGDCGTARELGNFVRVYHPDHPSP